MKVFIIVLCIALCSASSGPFVHPGVFLNREQLDFVKAKINAGAQPWKAAFDFALRNTQFSSPTQTVVTPPAKIRCGNANDARLTPADAIACKNSNNNAISAYTTALMWYYTGTSSYATKCIQILNAYSYNVIEYTHDELGLPFLGGKLHAAWNAELMVRAAEIIRHTSTLWSAADITQFERMLNNVFLPKVGYGHLGGGANWLLSMSDATINIGVFTNNRTTYDRAISYYKSWLPTHVYLKSDGNAPLTNALTVAPSIIGDSLKYWNYAPLPYPDGISQETCRDFTHEMYSATAAGAYTAETARIQGDDLYTFGEARMVTNHELHARWIMAYKANMKVNPSDWICPKSGNSSIPPSLGWEVGYNHYYARLSVPMPQTQAYLGQIRTTSCNLHMCWDTLTYGAALGTSATPKACVTANAVWQTALLNGVQNSNFFFSFKATPGISADNGVFGLSNGPQTSYANYAIIGRFDASGLIQAYQGTNGVGYTQINNFQYTAGVEYTITITVSVATKTFSMTAKSPTGTPVVIASGYGFRSPATQLTHYGFLDSYPNANTQFCKVAQNSIYLQ